MLSFVVVVNDSGELKTVEYVEFMGAVEEAMKAFGFAAGVGSQMIDGKLNQILDQRAIAAGEYDPSDNDTPMAFRGPPPPMEDDFEHDGAIVERPHDEHDLTR